MGNNTTTIHSSEIVIQLIKLLMLNSLPLFLYIFFQPQSLVLPMLYGLLTGALVLSSNWTSYRPEVNVENEVPTPGKALILCLFQLAIITGVILLFR
jgi:hypothetical protein